MAFPWAIAFARRPIFKIVSFLEYLVFFRALFFGEQLYHSCRMVFRMFLAFLIFDPTCPFCKRYGLGMDYSLCKIADFQNCPISRIFGVFASSFFAQNNCAVLVERLFACFWHFQFLIQTNNFVKAIFLAWAIAFARWPIFTIVSFFEYLMFFFSRFLHRTTVLLL